MPEVLLDWKTLAEVLPQVVWTADPQGKTDFFNRHWFDFTGLEPGDSLGWGWSQVIHPDDLPLCLQRWNHALQTGTPYETEYRFRRVDGQYRWFLGRGLPVRDAQGQVVKWVGSSTDIHDQKAAQVQAAEREARFASLVSNVPGVVYRCRCDANWTMEFLSERVLDLTGHPAQDFLDGSRHFNEVIHPEDRQKVADLVDEALARQQPYELEFRLLHKDGRVRWVHEQGCGSFDAQGTVCWLDGVILDITERRSIELERQHLAAQVEQEKDLLRAVLDQMPIAVWLGEFPSGKLLFGNKGIDAIWGHPFLPAEEIQGYREYHGFHLDGRPVQPHEWPLARAIAGQETVIDEEYDLLHPDGTLLRGLFSAAPIYNREGQQIAGVVTVLDISERQRAEKHIQDLNRFLEQRVNERTLELTESEASVRAYAEQLQQSNRELQDFATVVSHDLQEPLRKVQTFSDRVALKYAHEIGADGQREVRRIQAAAARMQELVQDLLTLARVNSRAREFVPVDLHELALQVWADLETHAEPLQASLQLSPLPVVPGDPTQLRQLLQNLISNSLKYHQEGVPPQITMQAVVDGQGCKLEIADNGIGFDEKYLDRIFNPFQRLHAAGKYDGTGMGLTICRKIVERHGGTLTARSTPGQGSVFVVRLPTPPQEGSQP